MALPVPAVLGKRRAEEHSGAGAARGPGRTRTRERYAVTRGHHPMRIARTFAAACALGITLACCSAFAALEATDTTWDGSEPPQGVYFHWYEPSFYTGFAPRTQDPPRLHIRLSRGNQVRVTVVLGNEE